jgi:outer membrane protein TolC
MRLQRLCLLCLLIGMLFSEAVGAQSMPAQTLSPPQAHTLAQKPGALSITLEDAIRMALEHNRSLLAARTTIQQSEAEEITANLRPNPVLLAEIRRTIPSTRSRLERFRYGDIHNSRSTCNEPARER